MTPTSNQVYDWYETSTEVYIVFYLQTASTFKYEIQGQSFISKPLTFELPYAIETHKIEFHANKVEVILTKAKQIKWDKLVEPNKYTEQKFDIGEVAEDEEVDLEKWLCDIYSKGNDDQKRAMNKSILESQGTVLSSAWAEVGKKKVERVDAYEEPEKRSFDKHDCK